MTWITNNSAGILILRLCSAVLMLFHGLAKCQDLSFIQTLLSGKGIPEFLAYGVYLSEVAAPLLILIGYRTRLAALVYTLGMIIAILLVHSADFFTRTPYGGWALELPVLYAATSASLLFMGGGAYSLSTRHFWD